MRYRLLPHAREQMEERDIPLELVEQVLEHPEQIILQENGRKVYQSIVRLPSGARQLLRLIVIERDRLIVVTVYSTSQIRRYWRDEE